MKIILPDPLLFIDIETVSAYPSYHQMPERWQHLWKQKMGRVISDQQTIEQVYAERAGIMAEFGRIVCIGMGWYTSANPIKLVTKAFSDADEKELLSRFLNWLNEHQKAGKYWTMAGHNIREFDIPFLCRRLLVHGLPIPPRLNWQQHKPWEIPVVDSFQLWRFGDYKQFTSLDLLAALFNIPSPKQEMCGSEVGPLYWSAYGNATQQQALNQIEQYCLQDVITTAQLIQALQSPTSSETVVSTGVN
ncbi:MAG TPA: ribonuclease H-like domain-containing protein, partial [Ferruginibacter sp.]|nr:ribonuclease H-like domain-containing protein [Ferruginibacter sp.]